MLHVTMMIHNDDDDDDQRIFAFGNQLISLHIFLEYMRRTETEIVKKVEETRGIDSNKKSAKCREILSTKIHTFRRTSQGG